ncbi:MAG: MFS transporter [Chloroflexota bacterium]
MNVTTVSVRANYQHLIWDIGWFGIALAATSRFMQFYAIRMGADAFELNLLTALPAIVLVFSTAMSAWWRSYFTNSVKAVQIPSFVFRLVFLLPAFAPFFPLEWRVLWLILSAAIPAMMQGMSNAIFVVMMRETISDDRIASLLARRQFVLNVMVLLGVLGFGVLLESLLFPLNYQVMFVIAFGFALLSQWHLTRLKPIVPAHKPKRREKGSLKRLLKTDEFQSVAYITLLTFVGYFSVFALIPLFLERNLGADEGYIALFGMIELIAGASIMLILEPIIRGLGSRRTIALSMFVTALASLAIAIAPSLELALIGAALTGIGWNAASVAILRYFTERTSADDMAASTAYHEIMFISMFIGPMLGNLVAATGLSLAGILLFGAMLRLLSAILTEYGLRIFGKPLVRPLVRVQD